MTKNAKKNKKTKNLQPEQSKPVPVLFIFFRRLAVHHLLIVRHRPDVGDDGAVHDTGAALALENLRLDVRHFRQLFLILFFILFVVFFFFCHGCSPRSEFQNKKMRGLICVAVQKPD